MYKVTGRTLCAGLLGQNVSQSLSPQLHNQWFLKHKIDAVYVGWSFKRAPDAELFLKSLQGCDSFLGANITIPYKELFLGPQETLDRTPQVNDVGAANTLFRHLETGRWTLDNTDVMGIKMSLHALCTSASSKALRLLKKGGHGEGVEGPPVTLEQGAVLILGAGGAAKAALWTVQQCVRGMVHLGVAARTPQKMSALSPYTHPQNSFGQGGQGRVSDVYTRCTQVRDDEPNEARPNFQEGYYTPYSLLPHSSQHLSELHWTQQFIADCLYKKAHHVVVVSTLPLAVTNDLNGPLHELLNALHAVGTLKRVSVFDMSYLPTHALGLAQRLGFYTIDGRLMLLTQAAHSFKRWTGIWPL